MNRSSRPSNTLQQENPTRPAITPRRALALRIHGHRRGFVRCIPAHVATTHHDHRKQHDPRIIQYTVWYQMFNEVCRLQNCETDSHKDRIFDIPQMASNGIYNYSTFDQTKTRFSFIWPEWRFELRQKVAKIIISSWAGQASTLAPWRPA